MLFRLFSCACVAVGLSWSGFTANHIILASPPPATRWVLKALGGKLLPASQLGALPLLVLPAVSPAQRSCYRGQFRPPLTARLLHLPRVISTMMRANDEAVETELRYLSALEQTTHFEVTGDSLQLYAAEQNTPIATFRAGSVL